MHGEWMGLARLAGWNRLLPAWWPYGGTGVAIEYTYAPLVPVLTALLSHLPGVSIPLAFHILSGAVYCLGPVTLYVMIWRAAGAPGHGFAAALLYSLLSPTQWIVPDQQFDRALGLGARRMFMLYAWDDLPHLTSLALMPLAAWFLGRGLELRRLRDCAWAGAMMALMMLANMFGVVLAALVVVTVPPAVERRFSAATFARAAAVGACAYLLVSPWLPPSLLMAIRTIARNNGESDTTPHALLALGIVASAMLIVWFIASRRISAWPVRWMVLFACPAILIPVLAQYTGLHFVPQPGRYRMEMELALAWLVPFCLPRLRGWVLIPLALPVLLQINSHREYAITMTKPVDVSRSIEYRSARWLSENMPGQRVMLVGSMAQWLNWFSDVPQISGLSYSTAPNSIQQIAVYIIMTGQNAGARDAETSLLWLKAYGAQAVGVPGPRSPEFWKPFANPRKFEGLLPALWREDDTTIYRVPQASTSLAHVMRPEDVVHRRPIHGLDTDEVQSFVAALDDPKTPPATFEWRGTNHARIHAHVQPGEVLAVQITYHPGWHARVDGAKRAVREDGIGLMTIEPECAGECEVELDFDGGVEAKVCRALSAAVLFGFAGWLYRGHRIRMRPQQ